MPHMSKVVFFPDSADIFNIMQIDGITYYILDKNNKYTESKVVNKSKIQNIIDSTEIRGISNRESLWNIGNEIYKHILNISNAFKFDIKSGRYEVWTNSQFHLGGGRVMSGGGLSDGGGNGGVLFTLQGNCNAVPISRILDTSKGEKSPSGASKCTFSSDDKAECESFVSWLNTKFTRFFVAINISKLTGILTDDYFRFVPAPPSGKFDHIYTDEELYKAFNLPQKYIDVIEAVIKERK